MTMNIKNGGGSKTLFWLPAFLLIVLAAAGCSRDPVLGIDSVGNGSAAETTRPRVAFTAPEDGASDMAINAAIVATFTENMAPATISDTSFTVIDPAAEPVPGTVSYSASARTATFKPSSALDSGSVYTATVADSATDLAGNRLAGNQAALPAASDYEWSFTTAATSDTTSPTVTLVAPEDVASDVCPLDNVNATFSEAMNPATISNLSFTLLPGGGLPGDELDAAVTYDAPTRIATLDPSDELLAGNSYTATVTTEVEDLAGNALTSDLVWSFTVDDTGCIPPPSPSILDTASLFGVFGGTAGMTNTGVQTVVNGDIGTTQTSTSSVTGFHDTNGDIYTETPANIGAVNGLIYTCTTSTEGPTSPTQGGVNQASCDIATQARLDAEDAFLQLQALPPGADPGQNLGGLTLAPGVYTAPGGDFLIQGSDLTLDAQGDASATWVFQMATTLTVGGPGAAAPQSIILANGAQAKNIFWAVGSAATINAAGGGTFEGTIISQDGVSVSTAGNTDIVTLNGRLLSLGASVTLVDTVINVPAP